MPSIGYIPPAAVAEAKDEPEYRPSKRHPERPPKKRMSVYKKGLIAIVILYALASLFSSMLEVDEEVEGVVYDLVVNCEKISDHEVEVMIYNNDDQETEVFVDVEDRDKSMTTCHIASDVWKAGKKQTYDPESILIPAKGTVTFTLDTMNSKGRYKEPFYVYVCSERYDLGEAP